MAYSGMLEKKRREDIDKTRKNNEMIYGIENFEEFYKGELKKDSKSAPRTINPTDYQPKRVDNSKAAEGFKNTAQREADYFSEFELLRKIRVSLIQTPYLSNFKSLLFRRATREESVVLRA